MRSDFVEQLLIEMEKNPKIIFLTGDLGFNALEPIQQKFPDRFFNMGIAEANMIGVAAGLALSGKKVIAYSIVPFITMRCYEQIRLDIAYHNLDVKLVGTGGGFNYGDQGVTHHATEDIAIMRVLPNLKIICPAYSWEVKQATKAMLEDNGPVYLRLAKRHQVDFYQAGFNFAIGRGFIIKDGQEIILCCTGNTLNMTMEIASIVEKALSKSVCVISLPTIKPLDLDLIFSQTKKAQALFTLEEGSIIGGLGAAVSQFLMETNLPKIIFKAFGLPDRFTKQVGSREYLCSQAGFDAQQISQHIIRKTTENK